MVRDLFPRIACRRFDERRTDSGRVHTRRLRLATLVAVAALGLAGCALEVKGSSSAVSDERSVAPKPVPTVVVLDASDSMNTEDAPGSRLVAAREAVTSLAAGLPDATPFGIVAFGSRMPARSTPQAVGCTDVTTSVPLGPLNRTALRDALGRLTAQGFTPISAALRQAASQLPVGNPSSIVLVSDGESTCEPPPCDTAAEIHRTNPNITISAVGFRTGDPALACVAEEGGGLFVTADNAAQLSSRLAAAQNAEAARSRLSPLSRAGVAIGATLADVRRDNPTFPATGKTEGNRTLYYWVDCEYAFEDDVLVAISPGDPPGSAGTTIDGVTHGTPGSRAVELYGEPLEDSGSVAVFTANEAAGTAYRIGYVGAEKISAGTVTTVVLCRCLPSPSQSGGPEVIKVIAVDAAGKTINGFSVGPIGTTWSSSDTGYCSSALGAATTGVYRCGTTADSANACWPSGNRLLCTFAPWNKALTAYPYSGSLPSLEPPNPDVFPWALELADGNQCVARNGGAWPMPPTGFEFGYSCKKDSKFTFVFYRTPRSRAATADLFDKSDNSWTVFWGDGEATATPTPVEVEKIYYSAAQ